MRWSFDYHLRGGCPYKVWLLRGYSRGSPDWRPCAGSTSAGVISGGGSTETGAGASSAGAAGRGAALGLGARRDLALAVLGGLTATAGLTAPTRPSSAARAAS